MALSKLRLASKKYKHEQRRRQKARKEKMRAINDSQLRSRRRKGELDYIHSLRDEIDG